MLWSIPEPLCSIRVEGKGSLWQRGEADFHKGKHRDLRPIAQERHRKLPPRYKNFHEGWLAIRGQDISDAGLQCCPRLDYRGLLNALRRPLMQGFHNEWKGRQRRESLGAGEHGIGGRWEPVLLQHAFGGRLVQTRAQGMGG